MSDAETKLREVIQKIAQEQDYANSKIALKPLSSGGANYTSQLFTVTLSAPGKDDIKLFAKIATLGEKIRAMSAIQVFETEIIFYTKILPKYREFEEVHNIPEEDKFVLPKYFGGSTAYMDEVLVLEELSGKGYQAFDRLKCFDWEYASKSVAALARLHAFSVAYERDDPETYSEMVKKLKFTIPTDEMKNFLKNRIETGVKATEEVNRARVEKYLKDELTEQTFLKYFNPKRRLFLTHGDFRPSNILHKKCEDGKLELVLVDYQMIQRGNPVCDLLFFLISGSDEDFRANHLHQYFNHYYETFSKTLQRLGIDPEEVYTEMDYRSDVKEMLPCGLSLGLMTLPVITVDPENAPKPEDGVDLDSFNMEVSDLFRERFNGLVRDYIKFGII
ncbi:uncharacterized protein [Epargyreus clarus]|uniref:uncharacterized protein n=1 Tax=Epargyreus clarus TaxID=520877 RepID=UPI003C2FA00B